MIKDQKITLNGTTIPNIREISVKVETPADKRGIYREATFAATISVTRDASDHAIVDLFGMATNEDGRKNILTGGSLEFSDDSINQFYSFTINKAFISSWTLNNPTSPNAPTLETIEIKVGSLSFNADGSSSNFELANFK